MIPVVNRLRVVVATRGPEIAIALAVVGALALAGAAWTYTHPATDEVTETTRVETVGVGVETSAYVAGNSSLWERGTVLRDRPIYPLSTAPKLRLRVVTTVPDGEPVDVTQAVSIGYRASREGTVFWETTEPLETRSVTTARGEVVTTTTLDVRRVRNRLQTVNEEVKGLGTASAYLSVNASYATGSNDGVLASTAPLTIAGDGYWIEGDLADEDRREVTVVRTVREPADRMTLLGLAALSLFGFGGSGAVALLARDLDAERSRHTLDRARYAEWISAGKLNFLLENEGVPMDTLADLVEVAIDSNRRVVHDSRFELYAVLTDRAVFYFDAGTPTVGMFGLSVQWDDDPADDWSGGREAVEPPAVFEGEPTPSIDPSRPARQEAAPPLRSDGSG